MTNREKFKEVFKIELPANFEICNSYIDCEDCPYKNKTFCRVKQRGWINEEYKEE